MQQSELTRMAIASAVAIAAMSYLAVDAGLVNTNVVTKPIKVAQASIFGTGMGHHHLAFAVQEWSRRGHEKPQLEHCLALD
ncbi:hypothetical protein C7U92_15665 [Bradyrhizobium sp. WBOS7]|uniref:DUF305 domain-containing protein n=1 Tax=Bradyrhizobium betae TaxID=244734 RepID=A0AAE9NCX6_9BRAD|nr:MULTISPECIES: hypothetical protein [Bradyrhizobium]MDD1572203.1 hypothetical protein [Bradyrhizobium sp. WBOS1]UUO37001.1 hypothetical protein DCK84_22125 [Bradyrhizobium sp. WBOS01]MDD1529064.1 hypothetical protein [Bradyrhizobium sp. WBOS2]MDD1578159.1 hypothetical protein [Bradyrhizobium sp. WBOS7]MDD1601463.1 hypothetical protein [Bradyrhizobium sp. WBOS16]